MYDEGCAISHPLKCGHLPPNNLDRMTVHVRERGREMKGNKGKDRSGLEKRQERRKRKEGRKEGRKGMDKKGQKSVGKSIGKR